MLRDLLFANQRFGYPVILFIIFLAWLLFWKGYGLWRAAKNDQRYWFIALLIISSLGILEIIYLLFFQKEKNDFKAKLLSLKNKLFKKSR